MCGGRRRASPSWKLNNQTRQGPGICCWRTLANPCGSGELQAEGSPRKPKGTLSGATARFGKPLAMDKGAASSACLKSTLQRRRMRRRLPSKQWMRSSQNCGGSGMHENRARTIAIVILPVGCRGYGRIAIVAAERRLPSLCGRIAARARVEGARRVAR